MTKKVFLFVGFCLVVSLLFTACKKNEDKEVSQNSSISTYGTVPFKFEKAESKLKLTNGATVKFLTALNSKGVSAPCVEISSYWGGTLLWELECSNSNFYTYDEAVQNFGTGDWRIPTIEESEDMFNAIKYSEHKNYYTNDVAITLGMMCGGGALNTNTGTLENSSICYYWVTSEPHNVLYQFAFAGDTAYDGGVTLQYFPKAFYKTQVRFVKRLE